MIPVSLTCRYYEALAVASDWGIQFSQKFLLKGRISNLDRCYLRVLQWLR